MKIIFMGTPALAAVVLEKLIKSGHEIKLAVTQPDKESGRGRNVVFSPVKQAALDAGIEIFQPENINTPEAIDKLAALKPDIFIIVAYAQKIGDRLLNMARFGCINLHPSLLPKYRGSSPFRGPILNGDRKTGVTVMKLDSGWDTGDILMQEEFEISDSDTALSLEEKAKELGPDIILKTLEALESNTITPMPQDEALSCYSKHVKKEDGLIDFSRSCADIDRQIRALIPWPSAYTYLDGKVFKIWEAQIVERSMSPDHADFDCPHKEHCKKHADDKTEDYAFGTVLYAGQKFLVVKCGDGCILLKEVQLEGKKRMDIEEFLRGKKLERGFTFGK